MDGDQPRTLAVGNLTAGIGHAALNLTTHGAQQHYDSSGSVVAQVAVGEDDFGIWYAGAVLPDVDELQLRRFMSCGLSGDWRRNDKTGSLELMAALSVPVPGFATPRSRVASGVPLTLVAAGMVSPAQSDLSSFGQHVPPEWTLRGIEASLVADASALDYDTLADTIVDRMERRQAVTAALTSKKAALLAELDDSPARMAALLASFGDDENALVADISTMPPQLKESYLHGKAAAKILWGTPDDFKRCLLEAEHHGIPAHMRKGMCATLHKDALGVWPGKEHGKGNTKK